MADLHLSLAGQDKSMEVFGGKWQDYVGKIERNWNKLVEPSDSVVVPGDISWGENINDSWEDFDFLSNKLNGTKYILKGNHDYWWDTAAKMTRFFDENGFSNIKIIHNNAYICEGYIICGSRGWFVDSAEGDDGEHNQKILRREAGRLELSIQAANKLRSAEFEREREYEHEIVVFLHYPPLWGSYICTEIVEVLEKYEIRRCYFGHVHNIGARQMPTYGNLKFELISADYLNFIPLKI